MPLSTTLVMVALLVAATILGSAVALRQPERTWSNLAACVSYFASLLLAIAGGVSVGLHGLRALPRLGYDLKRPVSGLGELIVAIAIPLLIICIAIYLGAILWLFVARFLFSRRQAEMVLFYGPSTRFDRWLLNAIIPPDRG